MEVGEELGRRGHEVSVVSPHKYKTVPPGVRDIVIQSDFDKLQLNLGNILQSKLLGSYQLFKN